MEQAPNATTRPERDLRALQHDHRDFLRILILDPRFAVALAIVLSLLVGAFVSLPKFWRTTPKGFQPQVRVSILNLVQVWQLRRTARVLEAGGRGDEALLVWHQALRKNLGNVETARSLLRAALAIPQLSLRMVEDISDAPNWLLSLSGTNETDVILVARFLDRAGFREDVFALLDPLKDRLSPDGEIAYLKTLVERGASREYATRWRRYANRLETDREFALYHAVYEAAWGEGEIRAQARNRLAQASADPALQVIGLRLQLLLAAHTGDVLGGEQALRQLENSRDDRLQDRTMYWGLLVLAGRQNEVRTELERWSLAPATARDVLMLANAYRSVGMNAEAHRLLQQSAMTFGAVTAPWTPALWLAWANLLASNRDWPGALQLVERIRASPDAQRLMGGWVDSFEARALKAMGQDDQAAQAYAVAARKPFPTPQVAFEVGLEMKRAGQSKSALALLLPLEPWYSKNLEFWRSVYELAENLKQDPVLLLRAASEVRRLHPDDRVARFNYGLALVSNRLNPSQAVVITREALDLAPDSDEAKVNHALALVMNQRFDEAASLLKSIDPQSFNDYGQSIYFYCLFGLELGRGNFERAMAASASIQTNHLFPNEAEWVRKSRAEHTPANPSLP